MLNKNVELNGKRILVTGAAGFIGANLVSELVKRFPECKVMGIDNMNDYYDVWIKEYRLDRIAEAAQYDD